MLRRTVLLVFASAAALAVAVAAGGAPNRAAEDELLETITVLPRTSVTSETNFQASERYKVVFSGSIHTQCEEGRPEFGATWDEDVFYVYNARDQTHPDPYPVGRGTHFTGTNFFFTSVPAFSGGHTYTVTPPRDLRGHFVFGDVGPLFAGVDNPRCTRTGAWTVKIYRVQTGTTKTVNEPAPGKSTFIESPPLPPGGVDCAGSPGRALSSSTKPQTCTVKFDTLVGDLEGTILFGEGGPLQSRAGYIFVSCWVHFQGTVSPADLVRGCVALTKYLLIKELGTREESGTSAFRSLAAAPASPMASAGACRTKLVTLKLRVRKGKVLSAKPVRNRKSAVRYSCTGSGGAVTLKVSGANLRKTLGKKLDLGVYRTEKAPRRSAKLTFTFGWK